MLGIIMATQANLQGPAKVTLLPGVDTAHDSVYLLTFNSRPLQTLLVAGTDICQLADEGRVKRRCRPYYPGRPFELEVACPGPCSGGDICVEESERQCRECARIYLHKGLDRTGDRPQTAVLEPGAVINRDRKLKADGLTTTQLVFIVVTVSAGCIIILSILSIKLYDVYCEYRKQHALRRKCCLCEGVIQDDPKEAGCQHLFHEECLTKIMECNVCQASQKVLVLELDRVCSICLEQVESQAHRLKCFHLYHQQCLAQWQKKIEACPVCREPI